MDIKSLSEILGHADVSITLNIYVHSSDKAKRKYLENKNQYLEAENEYLKKLRAAVQKKKNQQSKKK